jgi:hypothetical protein
MKLKLLLTGNIEGDSLLIEPKQKKVNFTIKCDNTGFQVSVDKWKLKELFMASDSKTIPARRKYKKIGMRFHK